MWKSYPDKSYLQSSELCFLRGEVREWTEVGTHLEIVCSLGNCLPLGKREAWQTVPVGEDSQNGLDWPLIWFCMDWRYAY